MTVKGIVTRFSLLGHGSREAGADQEITEMDTEAPEVEGKETGAGREEEEREAEAGPEADHGIDHMTGLRTDPETGPLEPPGTALRFEIPGSRTGTPVQSPSGTEGTKLL